MKRQRNPEKPVFWEFAASKRTKIHPKKKEKNAPRQAPEHFHTRRKSDPVHRAENFFGHNVYFHAHSLGFFCKGIPKFVDCNI